MALSAALAAAGPVAAEAPAGADAAAAAIWSDIRHYGCDLLGDVTLAVVGVGDAAAAVAWLEGRQVVMLPELETDELVVLAEPAGNLFLDGRYIWRERLGDGAGPAPGSDGPVFPVQLLWRGGPGEHAVSVCRFLR